MTIVITDLTGETVSAPASLGRTVAQVAALSGRWPAAALCSGLGRCGRCRVRFLSTPPAPSPEEAAVLSEDELAGGWRLGCRHPAAEGTRVFLPAHPAEGGPGEPSEADAPLDLAVDLGTTGIHWEAMDADGAVVASGRLLNPQMGAGSEIMTRLALAQDGEGERLRALAQGALADIAATVPGRVARLVVAGNSAMTAILLGKPVHGLAAAPYALDYAGDTEEIIADGLPPAYVPPLLAPFVGADLTAGLAALRFGPQAPRDPFLLADMGTNGEFLLALEDGSVLGASVPLGPALEGIGLRFGNVAGPGVVAAFSLTPQGLAARCLGDGEPSRAAGMTGTAYLSLLAHLVRFGLLNEEGQFRPGTTPLARRLSAHIGVVGGERVFELPDGMYVSGSDVEEVLKVKAAFNLALSALAGEAGLRPGKLAALCLAGAMGENVAVEDLESLGFIPSAAAPRVSVAGNTSLAGARLLLAEGPAREYVRGLPARTSVLDLTGDPAFGQEFVGRMRFAFVP